MTSFSGLGSNLSNLYRLSDARTRSISPENYTGEKGKGGMADWRYAPGKDYLPSDEVVRTLRPASVITADVPNPTSPGWACACARF